MKNYLNTFTQKSIQKNTEIPTFDQDDILMAADDVHRIAKRNPALYQTKMVPRLNNFSIRSSGSSGLV
jgi:hypothetical protein